MPYCVYTHPFSPPPPPPPLLYRVTVLPELCDSPNNPHLLHNPLSLVSTSGSVDCSPTSLPRCVCVCVCVFSLSLFTASLHVAPLSLSLPSLSLSPNNSSPYTSTTHLPNIRVFTTLNTYPVKSIAIFSSVCPTSSAKRRQCVSLSYSTQTVCPTSRVQSTHSQVLLPPF